MFGMPAFNINYLFYMLPAVLLGVITQIYVKRQYSRWSQVQNKAGMSGAQVAQKLANNNGMNNLQFKAVPGKLSDHYDPRHKVLGLSQEVGQRQSVASMAIAAHEMGHAQQDHDGYLLMRLRSALVPAVNIGTNGGWILIMLGLVLQISGLAWLGVIAFSAGLVFAVATLPVELNASTRARKMLTDSSMVSSENEMKGIKKVLNAAALTYVAAIATSLMQLLYFSSLAGGMGRRRR